MDIKKCIKCFFILLCVAAFAVPEANAQIKPKSKTTKKKTTKETDDSILELSDETKKESTFKDHLWYGGGLILGYNSNQYGSQFAFGVTPMVGYKFNSFLSAGPRVGVTFNSIKFSGYKAASVWTLEPGAFLRCKIAWGIYVHGELGEEFTKELYSDGTDIIKKPVSRTNQYLGLGYSQSDGGAGYDITVLYNFRVANEVEAIENPLGYRIGFTWNF